MYLRTFGDVYWKGSLWRFFGELNWIFFLRFVWEVLCMNCLTILKAVLILTSFVVVFLGGFIGRFFNVFLLGLLRRFIELF